MMPRPLRHARVGAVLAMIVALATAYKFDIFTRVADPKTLARTLVEMGPWGYLVFVVAYAVLQPFGVPGTVFVVAAPLIWPWRTAFVLSMTGTMLASVIGFSFTRFVARDWISARIPTRFRKYEEAVERNALQTVVLLRLLFWMPQALHAFFGVSRVRFWTHFWGSLLGYVPPLLLVSYFGTEMFDASGKMQPTAWPILGALLVVSLLASVVVRMQARSSHGTMEPLMRHDHEARHTC
jgi:uncharacterized membrane protein YdjX (TVP38/TMEM64 family)